MVVYAHLKTQNLDFERLFLPPSHSKGSEDVHFWIRVGEGLDRLDPYPSKFFLFVTVRAIINSSHNQYILAELVNFIRVPPMTKQTSRYVYLGLW